MNSIVSFDEVSTVNIEPTNICALHCTICNDNKTRQKGFMSLDLCEKIASQCSKKEIRLFMSGEPLFHPEIGKLISICRKYTDKVLIHTNAVLLNEAKSIELISSGLTHLSISFDGVTKDEYESIRVGANFEKVSKNINDFIRLNGGKNGKIDLSLQRIVKIGQEKTPLSVLFKGAKHYPVIIRHSWDVKDKVVGHRATTVYERNCFFPWHYMSVLWNGDVSLCCADLNGKEIIGNANIDKLVDIWNGLKMTSIRDKILNKTITQDIICSGCERYSS